MENTCIFAEPFKPKVYEETELILEETGINPFEKPFKPIKKDDINII